MTRAEHRIVSAVLGTFMIPEVDPKRMREEWRGGVHLVAREVYAITCSCGENGMAYRFEDIAPVFAGHLEAVAT